MHAMLLVLPAAWHIYRHSKDRMTYLTGAGMFARHNRVKAKRDTTILIWDHLFLCQVPTLGSRSVEDIKERGVRKSGIAKYDDEIPNLYSTVWISIAKMIEHYKSGVPVIVVNRSDCKKIFEFISEHITAWHDLISQGVNIGSAPFEDLIIMDRFANTVFEVAKYDMIQADLHGKMMRDMYRASNLSPDTFFSNKLSESIFGKSKTVNGVTHVGGHVPDEVPVRQSAETFFKEGLFGSPAFNINGNPNEGKS